MIYNTQKKKLVLPEYGRNIQNMVDHCLSINDRDERKKCAYAVVEIMGNMFPHLRDVNDFKHILWDHLAIMADFKLDIDFPYEVVTSEDLQTKPDRLNYSRPDMKYRHYGKLLERMITIAADMEEDDKREQHPLSVWVNAADIFSVYLNADFCRSFKAEPKFLTLKFVGHIDICFYKRRAVGSKIHITFF